MAIHSRTLSDNSGLMREIASLNAKEGDVVCVKVYLPDYLDITSMMAMSRRMAEVAEQTHVTLRLLTKTKNMDVEKFATRLFAERDDIYLTVDWRDEHAENAERTDSN